MYLSVQEAKKRRQVLGLALVNLLSFPLPFRCTSLVPFYTSVCLIQWRFFCLDIGSILGISLESWALGFNSFKLLNNWSNFEHTAVLLNSLWSLRSLTAQRYPACCEYPDSENQAYLFICSEWCCLKYCMMDEANCQPLQIHLIRCSPSTCIQPPVLCEHLRYVSGSHNMRRSQDRAEMSFVRADKSDLRCSSRCDCCFLQVDDSLILLRTAWVKSPLWH